MNTKSISRISGVLYILTNIAFLVSALFLRGPLVDADDLSGTLQLVAENAFLYRLAVSIDFLAIVAVMALSFSLFAILKPVGYYLALLALGMRIGEVILQAVGAVPAYALLTLSQSAVSTPGSGTAELVALGQMLLDGYTQALSLSLVFFAIGSLFNNFLFYKSKAIPAALAIFGLISTGLFTLTFLLALIIDLPLTELIGLPMLLFELLLGFYLAIFGMKQGVSQ